LLDDGRSGLKDLRGASWAPRRPVVIVNGAPTAAAPVAQGLASAEAMKAAAKDSIRARMLIRAYRVRGHLEASLDPLDLKPRGASELDPRLTASPMPIWIGRLHRLPAGSRDGIAADRAGRARDLLRHRRRVHVYQDPAQKARIQERIEVSHNQTRPDVEANDPGADRRRAVRRFLDRKYTGTGGSVWMAASR
jgi:2-oxoglutarate dehydrogenase E1 component